MLAPAVVFGQPVTLTLSVTPTITVLCSSLLAVWRLGAVTRQLGAALIVTTTLPVGAHPITATYGGYNHYAPSLAAPITLDGGQGERLALNWRVRLWREFWAAGCFTATVGATPPGQERRRLSPPSLWTRRRTPWPLVNGVATYQATNLAVGQHPATASYGGTCNFLLVSAAVYTQTARKAETTTTLVLAPNPAKVG